MIYYILSIAWVLGVFGFAIVIIGAQGEKIDKKLIFGLLAWPICLSLAILDELNDRRKKS